MARRFLLLATLVAAVAAMAAGCGGDDDSDSSAPAAEGNGTSASETSEGGGGGANGADADGDGESIGTSSLDKSQFVKRANVVCADERKGLIQKVQGYVAEHQSEELPPPVMTAKFVKKFVVPIVEAQIEDVRRLGAPAGDEEEIEAMLEAQRVAVDELKELDEVDPVNGPVEQFKDVTPTYERYGLRECSYAL